MDYNMRIKLKGDKWKMKESTSVRLKMIMEERNLKQVDIINKCQPYCKKYNVKLTKNYLSQYVSGKVEPGQRTLTILGLALNLNEAWLMGFDVPKERGSMPQSEESPVLKAIYNSEFKDTKIAEEFINKKLSDRLEFDFYDYELLTAFKKLSTDGKIEAIHRVVELSFIPGFNIDNQ
jgi:transcriptional regulator with XRE-family HTH domain